MRLHKTENTIRKIRVYITPTRRQQSTRKSVWLKATYNFREFARLSTRTAKQYSQQNGRKIAKTTRHICTKKIKKSNRTEAAVYSDEFRISGHTSLASKVVQGWEGSETAGAARRGAGWASRRPHASATRGEKRPQEAVQRRRREENAAGRNARSPLADRKTKWAGSSSVDHAPRSARRFLRHGRVKQNPSKGWGRGRSNRNDDDATDVVARNASSPRPFAAARWQTPAKRITELRKSRPLCPPAKRPRLRTSGMLRNVLTGSRY